MKEQQFRNKITWFTFVFSLLVVWVHSYNAELYMGKTAKADFLYKIEHGIGETVSQIAVPGFFMISAYLFYRNFSWKVLGRKWNSRIKSILVPFITWNFIYYMCYVVGSRLPWMTDVIGKGTIPFNLPVAVDAVLNYTYNYVFWYLYQLILLILLTPLIYFMLKLKPAAIAFLTVLWILLFAGVQLPLLNLDALIYYTTASSLALHGADVVESSGSGGRKLVSGVAVVAAGSIIYYLGLRFAYPPFFVLCRLLLVAGLWLAVDQAWLPPPRPWVQYNFFLYATHFGMVRFINKVGAGYLPLVMPVPLLLFLVMPLITLAISYYVGKCLRYHVPLLWQLLNGGR